MSQSASPPSSTSRNRRDRGRMPGDYRRIRVACTCKGEQRQQFSISINHTKSSRFPIYAPLPSGSQAARETNTRRMTVGCDILFHFQIARGEMGRAKKLASMTDSRSCMVYSIPRPQVEKDRVWAGILVAPSHSVIATTVVRGSSAQADLSMPMPESRCRGLGRSRCRCRASDRPDTEKGVGDGSGCRYAANARRRPEECQRKGWRRKSWIERPGTRTSVS